MPKKTLKEMEAELRSLRSQIRQIRRGTKVRGEIAKARFTKRKASFGSFVGKWRARGYTFTEAVKAAKKEYDKLTR